MVLPILSLTRPELARLCLLSNGWGVVMIVGSITGSIWLPVCRELASFTRPLLTEEQLELFSLNTFAFFSTSFVILVNI